MAYSCLEKGRVDAVDHEIVTSGIPLITGVPYSRDGVPDALRCCGHVDMADAVGAPERVHDRIDDGRARTDRARFARAFQPERIGLARHVACLEYELRCMLGTRHRVVHEARAEQLTGRGIVYGVLHQRLADTLHRSAMHLALEKEWIERRAKVIDNDVTHDA